MSGPAKPAASRSRRLHGDDPDHAWERYGSEDPYFGVLADPRYHTAALTEERRTEFLETGTRHVAAVLDTVRRHLDPAFRPVTALDFGCGVGRVTLALARSCRRVTAIDVASSMVREGMENARRSGVGNVDWSIGDLSAVSGRFDLVHSYIVLQHLPVQRMSGTFDLLLDRVAEGGIAALQFLYARRESPARGLFYWARRELPTFNRVVERMRGPGSARLMQMNPTPLVPVLLGLQERGFGQVHVQFSDHGTARTKLPGIFLFAQRAPGPAW